VNATLPASVRLSEFLPNPKGNGAREWVELVNDADMPADLSGWAIDDAEGGGSPYRLPQGSSIAPHGLLVITSPKALFNNDGDTVRLLLPDGRVADQYSYTQSSADRSVCRTESKWSLCDPSPNAPNRAAMSPSMSVVASPMLITQTLGLATNEVPSLQLQSVVDDSPLLLWLPTWSQGAFTAAPSYANATSGVLYRGVARATPIHSFSTPTNIPSAAYHEDVAPDGRPPASPMGMGTGIFLFVAGAAVFGYDWLRSRRMPPRAPAQDELFNVLDADLPEEDQDL